MFFKNGKWDPWNEVPALTFIQMEESEEKVPPKQTAILSKIIQGKLAQSKKSTEEVCIQGPQCLICAQSAPNLTGENSEDKDWNGQVQGTKKEDQLERNYYPPIPQ